MSWSASTRVVEVDPERLERWLTGFADRHGGADVTRAPSVGGEVVTARGADGSLALATPFAHDPLCILLIRRAAYAAGLATGGALLAHKVGTRHIHGRTAAGGWSQQRYARRRANQADELVSSVVGHVVTLLRLDLGSPAGLVVGGDRALVQQVLSAPALRPLTELPRRELYDLRDPDRRVLDEAIRRGRAVRIQLTDPPG